MIRQNHILKWSLQPRKGQTKLKMKFSSITSNLAFHILAFILGKTVLQISWSLQIHVTTSQNMKLSLKCRESSGPVPSVHKVKNWPLKQEK